MLLPNEWLPSWSRIRLPMKEMHEIRVQSLSREDALENKVATHSSILAWETPWTIALQALISMGFPRQEY